ncbi:MAG: hypothetical protein EAX81_01560 [Candidatus Thorarchaeota archaeon]|nr:hypothetical protein [Candidatus Thorarchaeota archaeon]
MRVCNESNIFPLRETRTLKSLSVYNRALISTIDDFELLAEIYEIDVREIGHRLVWSVLDKDNGRRTAIYGTSSNLQELNPEKVDITKANTKREHSLLGTIISTEKSVVTRGTLTDSWFDHLVLQRHYTRNGGL